MAGQHRVAFDGGRGPAIHAHRHVAQHSARSKRRDAVERRKGNQRNTFRITGGNVTQAAKLAKRNRSDFYTLLNRHQIDPGQYKPADQ